MAGSSGISPLAWPRPLADAPARAADSRLFADSLAGADMGLAQALGEALMPRIAGRGPWPVQFVLHLAHRGQVNVSAGYAAQGWHITLGAQQAGTRHWLARQRQACQRRLGRALGQPVSLQLMAQYL